MSNKKVFKRKKGDKVYWLEQPGVIGDMVFSFDGKKRYNLFRDYPHKLSVKEWLVFNAENEYWKNFFADRNAQYELEHDEEINRAMN